jgi:hypothetical protein
VPEELDLPAHERDANTGSVQPPRARFGLGRHFPLVRRGRLWLLAGLLA